MLFYKIGVHPSSRGSTLLTQACWQGGAQALQIRTEIPVQYNKQYLPAILPTSTITTTQAYVLVPASQSQASRRAQGCRQPTQSESCTTQHNF
jgi:hypothetical protein